MAALCVWGVHVCLFYMIMYTDMKCLKLLITITVERSKMSPVGNDETGFLRYE